LFQSIHLEPKQELRYKSKSTKNVKILFYHDIIEQKIQQKKKLFSHVFLFDR